MMMIIITIKIVSSRAIIFIIITVKYIILPVTLLKMIPTKVNGIIITRLIKLSFIGGKFSFDSNLSSQTIVPMNK